jgi:tetratricopeptide (TPR) repeat protein
MEVLKMNLNDLMGAVATTLNSLGNVLRELRRFEEAEEAYREVLEIRRRLADKEPQVYEPGVVTTLNNLGAKAIHERPNGNETTLAIQIF